MHAPLRRCALAHLGNRSLALSGQPVIRASRAIGACAMSTLDPCSLANPHEAIVHNTTLELDVLFGSKTIEGWAELDVRVVSDSPSQLILDTNGLVVHRVELLHGPDVSAPMPFQFGDQHEVLGKPLQIRLPPSLTTGQELRVGLRWTTPTSSSALQWLSPEQTAGKEHPYLFSQCQAIHARALFPCQDTPGAKMTYSACVRVPEQLTALMSAVPVEEGQHQAEGLPHLDDLPESSGPTRTFSFHQKVPIPPYLLALAAGQLESRELSTRSRVWSEPSMVAAGAYEFAGTEAYLAAGEAVAGPYVWGRYDLLLLPPSFPYGGMENPVLTFVTPTLLAGDRSLTNVVAHEIAHSWTGNLVTNATWAHFWCNEGCTVWLERKILRHLNGEDMFQFAASNGWMDLADDVRRLGPTHPFTCLVPDLSAGIDPDDAFSKVPYEKGFAFIYYLNTLVGGAAKFDPFFKAYIMHFAYKTVTSDQFKAYFCDYFKDEPALAQIDWEAWFHSPGMPPVTNVYDTKMVKQAWDLAKKWHTCDVMGIGGQGPVSASATDIEGWSSELICAFLDKLSELRTVQPMHATTVSKLASLYSLYSTPPRNAEIRGSFFRLALAAEDPECLPHVTELVATQGRMKFLRPMYRSLFHSKMGKQLALDLFATHKASYHPIAVKMVGADLGV